MSSYDSLSHAAVFVKTSATWNKNKIYLSKELVAEIKENGESDDWCIFCGQPDERK